MGISARCIDGLSPFNMSLNKQPGGPNGASGDGSDRLAHGILQQRTGLIQFESFEDVNMADGGYGLTAVFTHDKFTNLKGKVRCNCPGGNGTSDTLYTEIRAAYTKEVGKQTDPVECTPPPKDTIIPYRNVLAPAILTVVPGNNKSLYTPVALVFPSNTDETMEIKTRFIQGSRPGMYCRWDTDTAFGTIGGNSYTTFKGGLTIYMLSNDTGGAVNFNDYGYNLGPILLEVSLRRGGVSGSVSVVTLSIMDTKLTLSQSGSSSLVGRVRSHSYTNTWTITGGDPGYEFINGSLQGTVNIGCSCPGSIGACAGSAQADKDVAVAGSTGKDTVSWTVTHAIDNSTQWLSVSVFAPIQGKSYCKYDNSPMHSFTSDSVQWGLLDYSYFSVPNTQDILSTVGWINTYNLKLYRGTMSLPPG